MSDCLCMMLALKGSLQFVTPNDEHKMRHEIGYSPEWTNHGDLGGVHSIAKNIGTKQNGGMFERFRRWSHLLSDADSVHGWSQLANTATEPDTATLSVNWVTKRLYLWMWRQLRRQVGCQASIAAYDLYKHVAHLETKLSRRVPNSPFAESRT